jgi:hypothetical protein
MCGKKLQNDNYYGFLGYIGSAGMLLIIEHPPAKYICGI